VFFVGFEIITNKSEEVLIIILSGVVLSKVTHIHASMCDLLKDRGVDHFFYLYTGSDLTLP
jgi:hypothetical protein